MKIVIKTIKFLDGVSNWVGKISSWSVIVMMLLVMFEVFSRRILNSPTLWTHEVITMIFGFYFMMVISYGLLHKSLVSVDIFYEKLSVKTKAVLDLVTYAVFFLPFVIGVLYGSFQYAKMAWIQQELSWSALSIPIYPIKTVIPVAMFFILIQGISEILKRIVTLNKGKWIYD